MYRRRRSAAGACGRVRDYPGRVILFAGSRLSDYTHQYTLALHEEVYRTPDDEMLTVDTEAWATALGEAYAVHAPVLHPEGMEADEPVSEVVPWGGYQAQATVVRLYVPFSGDANVFKYQPSKWTANPPEANLLDGTLQVSVVWTPDRPPPNVRETVAPHLARIEQYLAWSRHDCYMHNNGLDGYARGQIGNRADEIRQPRAVLHASGIPLRGGGGKRNITAAIRRRPGRQHRGPGPAVPLDPVLGDKDYAHMLGVMRNQGDTMQRAPGAYAGMGEEDLRQVLLSGLNTHYVGGVTGEAFSVSGRTDIMVRDGGGAVFIAECKVWTGRAAVGPALGQLLGYTTWNDTKMALVLFVRLANLGDSVARAQAALTAHAAVATLEAADATTLRGRLVYGDEGERKAELAVLFIHLPAGS